MLVPHSMRRPRDPAAPSRTQLNDDGFALWLTRCYPVHEAVGFETSAWLFSI